MGKQEYNYKDDFDFILMLKDCNDAVIGWPDFNWVARFWTTQKANAVTASCIDGECVNCFNDGGQIHIVMNGHRLSAGVLNMEFTALLDNDIYPDGDKRVVSPIPLDIELIRGCAPCPCTAEVVAMLPYIKFQYEDLTPEQKADLQAPATEAAQRLDAFVEDATTAEEKRVADEWLRVEAENVRVSQEAERESAETTRRADEAERIEAEGQRDDAETERRSAESARAKEFASWETELDSKADRSELSNVFAQEPMTPDNFPGISTYTREELKMDLFIDMFNAKAGNNGYARITNGAFDCQLNGVPLSYAEAINIMLSASVQQDFPIDRAPSMAMSKIRTHFPIAGNGNGLGGVSMNKTYKYCPYLEVSIIKDGNFNDFNDTYYKCEALTKVIIGSPYGAVYNDGVFVGCTSLVDFQTSSAINSNINFAECPKLSLASMQNIVFRGKNEIQVTVHPDVYAKLTDETNTEWHALIAQAAEKNITFATV